MPEPTLELVTSDNIEAACAIRLMRHQDAHVELVAESLALARTLPTKAWPRLVYDRSALVAFVMAFHQVDWPGDASGVTRSGLWRLNVDAEHQHQGYGRFAVLAVCADLRERGERTCFVTYDAGEDGPENFYLKLGFRPTGEFSGRQVVAYVMDFPRVRLRHGHAAEGLVELHMRFRGGDIGKTAPGDDPATNGGRIAQQSEEVHDLPIHCCQYLVRQADARHNRDEARCSGPRRTQISRTARTPRNRVAHRPWQLHRGQERHRR